jgi:hypothetical protein
MKCDKTELGLKTWTYGKLRVCHALQRNLKLSTFVYCILKNAL